MVDKFSNSNLRGRGLAQPLIAATTVDHHGHLGKETRQGVDHKDKFNSRHLAVVKEKPCFDLILIH